MGHAPQRGDWAAERFIVSGRVQGVGYRGFVQVEALSLGLKGWVRNRFDGTVELVAAGPAADREELVRRLRIGPAAARVVNVRRAPAGLSATEIGRLRGFEITFEGD